MKDANQSALALEPQAPVEDGAYENMPFSRYAAIPALNGSSLVNMRRSPMYYKFLRDNPQPTTPAMFLGTIVHRLILEPDRVGDIAVWGLKEEEKVRRGKVWESFKEANPGKILVTEGESEKMVGMAVAVRKYLPIRKYADAKGPSELSLVWTDKTTGRRFKARVDKWIPSLRTVFDLKSTRSCQPRRFGAQAYQLGYHIKMAIQWLGVKALLEVEPHLKLGALESEQPHESAVYRITKDVLLQGLEEMDVLVRTLTECERKNHWPAEMEEESDLILPTWATDKAEEDLSEFAIEEE